MHYLRLSAKNVRLLIAAFIPAVLAACSYSGASPPTTESTPTTIVMEIALPPTATTPATSTFTPTSLPATQTLAPTVPTATHTLAPTATQTYSSTLILGHSLQGWPIEVFRFGTGPVRLAFIGGIHGGYEWNTILLAYRAIDYFNNHPEQVPPEISLFIIPAANPDGQIRVIGHTGRFSLKEVNTNTVSGRFNSREVDLNRNWDCNWEPDGIWRNQKVSAGEAPFSEVETQILRDFLRAPPMAGVVFWHSAVPAVYAGGCGTRHAPSDTLAEIYAKAADYPFELKFIGYPVSGNAIDWLATQDIPAIEVELRNHRDTDWEHNLNGITQILHFLQNSALQQ